jgi:outer membrane murein-binding lipoprotein Lpp
MMPEEVARFTVLLEDIQTQVGVIADGHAGLTERMDRMDCRFDRLEAKVDGLEVAVGALATKVDGLEVKVGVLATRADGLDAKLDGLRDELKQELAQLATKTELEIWGGALLARIESGERRLIERLDLTEQRLHAELARHTAAVHESMSALLAARDEKFADLPGRVSWLEAAVFAPKQP